MTEALKRVIQNAGYIADELSWLCLCDDKRSGHLAEKFGFQYVKTFYCVQKVPADEPKDFFYVCIEALREMNGGEWYLVKRRFQAKQCFAPNTNRPPTRSL